MIFSENRYPARIKSGPGFFGIMLKEMGPRAHMLSKQGESLMATWLLSVQVTEEEHALLEAAAELARTSVAEFIRRKTLDAAERDLLERQLATIAAEDWDAFEGWAHRPAGEIHGLKNLASKLPTPQT